MKKNALEQAQSAQENTFSDIDYTPEIPDALQHMNLKRFTLYNSVMDTAPDKYISVAELLERVESPTVEPKGKAAALVPFLAEGKTKEAATASEYFALVLDHDDDNKTADEIRATYDPWGVTYLAFTSASHQQDKKGVIANRWKVVIPLDRSISAERYAELARGVALVLGTDDAQARAQQVFFAPNKISEAAPYDFIDETARDFLDPYDESHPLISAAVSAYKRDQERREAEARAAPPKPRAATLGASDGGIIDKVCQQFPDLEGELQHRGYQKRGRKFLSPQSSTGTPGVYVFTGDDGKERCYSHHGATDPLSSLNHDGHALDVFDVICTLDYAGDVSRAVAELAPLVDPDGQRRRQREHMAAQEVEKAAANFEVLTAQPEPASDDSGLPAYPDELLCLPHQLGELQYFIANSMSYPSLATAGITAFASLTAFAQTNMTIKSRAGLGFNEYYLVLAPTGFGKEDLRNPIERLHHDSDDLLRQKGFALADDVKLYRAASSSKQGLHQCLEHSRSVFFLSDEFAEWLRQSHNDGHKQAALGYLMEIYTKALGTVEPGHAVTQKYTPVKNPRLSILATSTAEAIFEHMTREQADSGAYNRWVIFAGEDELPPKRYDGLEFTPKKELVEFIAWVKEQTAQVLSFSKAGYAEYKRLDTELAEPIKRRDGVLGGRLGEQAIKLAGLVALSDRRFKIEPSDLQTAFNIRIGLYRRAAALTTDKGSLSGMHKTGEALEQVVGLFRKNRCLRKSELKTNSRKYAKLTVHEQQAVLRLLIDEGHARPDPDKMALLHSNYFERIISPQ